MRRRIALCLLVASLALLNAGARAGSTQSDARAWSQELNGLQVRLELVEKGKLYGTRWLVPYLELRNVRDVDKEGREGFKSPWRRFIYNQ
jgi:hypothetical protein